MADGFEISIDVIGDLSNLMTRVMQRAIDASQAGAERLVAEHEEIIQDWSSESKPEFIISPPDTDGITFVLRTIRAVGERWHWINEGTGPVTITGKRMRFPWEIGNHEYNSSFGPKLSQDFSKGSGLRHGDDFVASVVTDRSIRPRHMDEKAIERAKDDVMAAMQAFFP